MEPIFLQRCVLKLIKVENLKKTAFMSFFGLGLACQAKGLNCHTKNHPLPKHLREKMSKSVKYRLPLCNK